MSAATKRQAVAKLGALGLELAEGAGVQPGGGFFATIDAKGRNGFSGDCRGHVVNDYTATAAEFWAEVIREAVDVAPYLTPCPFPPGECEFHDDDSESGK